MATKKTSFLSPLLVHRDVSLNRDTDLLKVIAVISMLVDHTGKMFFSQYMIMRIIGRLAFPIFAYCVAVGCVYTRNHARYLSRKLMTGLISQPFYAMALGHTSPAMFKYSFFEHPVRATVNFYMHSWGTPNIMLTLALGLIIIWALRERQYFSAAAVMLLTWLIQNSVNYGWRGVALILLFYLFIEQRWLSLPVLLAFMVWWGMDGSGFTLFGVRFGIQMFAVPVLFLIYIPTRSRLKINKWVFYAFYPAHLIGIMLVEFAMALAK